MDRSKFLTVFLTVSVLSCLCNGRKVEVPKSVTAVEGSCVTMPCSTSPHSHVVWYLYRRSSSPVVYSRETANIKDEFRGRTSVPGNSEQGDCSLRIDRVRPEDNKESLYPWIHPDTGNSYDYIAIKVVKPGTPTISMDSPQEEGKLFSARCTVQHSCPSSPPLIKWLGLSPVSVNVTTTMGQDGLWTSVSQAQFRPNHQDHGQSFSCNSMYSSNSIPSKALRLNVLYAPTNVKITWEEKNIIEDKNVVLTCTSNSNPPPTNYEWHVNQSYSTSQSEPEFNLQQAKRDMSVSCTAQNSFGRSKSEERLLNVQFSPTILQDSVCSDWAGGMQCVCKADAEPRATISWVVDGNSVLLPKFTTLVNYAGRKVVSELTGPKTLNVSCEASNYLGRSIYQIPTHQPLSGGTVGLIVAAVLCFVFGIGVIAGCYLKKRKKRLSADSTSRSHTELSGISTKKCATKSVYNDEDLYVNDTGHLYTNNPGHHTHKNEMEDIYENC